jgi:hypothetical protein
MSHAITDRVDGRDTRDRRRARWVTVLENHLHRSLWTYTGVGLTAIPTVHGVSLRDLAVSSVIAITWLRHQRRSAARRS